MYQDAMYQVKRASQSRTLPIRGLAYHLRTWGEPKADVPPLVMVHGWMDIGASFQFMVDAMADDRWVIAPDLRGFGDTRPAFADSFWFADYLADLDAILHSLVGDQPIDLLGHSLGGHVATTYAGVRPNRIRRLINLEGFGLASTRPSQAPGRYAQWLDEIAAFNAGEKDLKTYESLTAVANRLTKTNPRLSADKAAWLAGQWASKTTDGRWQINGHAAHKVVGAHLFQAPETVAIYERITAPTLFVRAAEDSLQTWWKNKFTQAEFAERLSHIPQVETRVMADVGHMLHHDKPVELAEMVMDFLT
jgi:pimeloyl-ACP methyl ester carboxylesterase